MPFCKCLITRYIMIKPAQKNASEKIYKYDILTKVKFNGNDNMQLFMKFDINK